jgi:hypothetical protein
MLSPAHTSPELHNPPCVRAGERIFVGLTQPARKPTYFQKFHGSCFVQPFSYKSRFKVLAVVSVPRARELEPAPRRLVGGMARDVCRPHQEDRPAQGRTGIVRYALATTGGDEPPQRAAPRYLRGCSIPAENSVLCAVVLPAGQVGVIQAWRRDALSCDVRCAPPGAPTEALKSAADMPWGDSNAGATDHARLNTSRV